MTPEALARETARLNVRLIALVRELASRVGMDDPADRLAQLRSNPRRPAETMLSERRVLVDCLEGIVQTMATARPDPPDPPAVTLEPSPVPEGELLGGFLPAARAETPLPPPVVTAGPPRRQPRKSEN